MSFDLKHSVSLSFVHASRRFGLYLDRRTFCGSPHFVHLVFVLILRVGLNLFYGLALIYIIWAKNQLKSISFHASILFSPSLLHECRSLVSRVHSLLQSLNMSTNDGGLERSSEMKLPE